MRLPPESVLVGALRWLEVLGIGGDVPRARALLTGHPQYSDLTPTQYQTALAWLEEVELLRDGKYEGDPRRLIINAIFKHSPPVWFRDADTLVQSPNDLPADALQIANALVMDHVDLFEVIVSCWGKVDAEARSKVGYDGELELAEALRSIDNAVVSHVSQFSDGYGYDLKYRCKSTVAHLEVKSSSRRGRFTAYLSRHEYNVMLRDEYWQLVLVRLSQSHSIEGVGSVSKEWILENVPLDSGRYGCWSSVKFDIPSTAVASGIAIIPRIQGGALPSW